MTLALTAIKERLAGITPGPWMMSRGYRAWDIKTHDGCFVGKVTEANAAFIAASPADMQSLVDEVERQAAEIAGLRIAGQHLLDMIDAQDRAHTPTPARESVDDANSRNERDLVLGDAVARFRAALGENQP